MCLIASIISSNLLGLNFLESWVCDGLFNLMKNGKIINPAANTEARTRCLIGVNQQLSIDNFINNIDARRIDAEPIYPNKFPPSLFYISGSLVLLEKFFA